MHSDSHIDSDRAALEVLPRVRPPRQWRRFFETVGVVGSLFLGGFGSGYFWAARTAEAQMTRQREDHLAEIARLREAFGDRLSSLTGRVNHAADTAASAAQTAAQAANQAAKTAAKELKKP